MTITMKCTFKKTIYQSFDKITFNEEGIEQETDIVVLTVNGKSRLYMELANCDYYWLSTETTLERDQEPTEAQMHEIIEEMIARVKETYGDEKLCEIYLLDYADSAFWDRERLANYILEEQMF